MQCKECLKEGIDYRRRKINTHVRREHGLTKEQYLEKYPESFILCEDVNEVRIATVREKYGVDNVFQSEEIIAEIHKEGSPAWTEEARQRREATNLKRYGHENPLGGEGGDLSHNLGIKSRLRPIVQYN